MIAGTGLLFIAGSGRSGSTLLEQLLTDRVGGLAIGEARFFFGFFQRGDVPCGCGAALPECEFWAPIGRRLQERFDFARIERERRRRARIRSLLLPRATGRLLRAESELSTAYRALYRLVAERSGDRVVVDSSKIPTHLAILETVLSDRTACLHLVRDPRAVAWAFSRRVKRDPASPQRGGLMLRRRTLTALVVWALENAWTMRISRGIDRRALIRYEDLVRAPRRTIEGVVMKLCPDHRASQPAMFHSVGGNPVRFEGRPRVVREDREWAESSTAVFRGLTGVAVYPLLRAFGYSLRLEPRA